MIPTPYLDKIFTIHTLKTRDNYALKDVITPHQRLIAEAILTRRAPDGSGKKRIHIMAHTRYGKSQSVGAATAVRAALKKERWLIIAPDQDKAQIIMDYVIHTVTNDPILKTYVDPNLVRDIEVERLTQRRSRDHLTFLGGGEVRAVSASKVMGLGCPNVILDEAGLIDNDTESKIFRMLGDNPDNFYVKIGNPWDSMDISGEEHHFYASYQDTSYYTINIDYMVGLAEGRLSREFINEVSKKPNFSVLYENIYPSADKADKDGYLPIFTDAMLKKAIVEPGTVAPKGENKIGVDPADGGDNESIITKRWKNLLRVLHNSTSTDVLTVADKAIAEVDRDTVEVNIDKQGVGSGAVRRVERTIYKKILRKVNAGESAPTNIKEMGEPASERYENLRAWLFFQVQAWLLAGGKLERKEGVNYGQLLSVKYKNSKKGKIQIISKDELRKRKINDLGVADGISFTFLPDKPKMGSKVPTGGVDDISNVVYGNDASKPATALRETFGMVARGASNKQKIRNTPVYVETGETNSMEISEPMPSAYLP